MTGSGSVFARLGKIGFLTNSVNSFRGTATLGSAGIVSVGPGTNNIEAQYQSTDQQTVDGIYSTQAQYRNQHANFLSALATLASNTVVQMAVDDGAVTQANITASLKALASQMVLATASINQNTVSVATGAGTNTGTAVIAASVKDPTGKVLQYPFAEILTATCATDFQTNTATAGNENWSVVGQIPQSDPLSYLWPAGSGAQSAVTAVDGTNINLLANGNFETWVGSVPTNFTITTGSGTVTKGAVAYRGTGSLAITGDGSTLTKLRQQFGAAAGSGTTYTLLPSTVYALSFWAKVSTVSSLAGVLKVSIVDSGFSITTDAASTSNSFSVTLSGSVNTTYANFTAFFRTPAVVATTPYSIQIELTTAVTNATVLYVDDLTLVAPQQVYTGGPFVAIFSGSANSVKGDTLTATVSNNFGGVVATLLERWFQLRANGLSFPFSGSPTVPDSVVG